MTLMDRAQGQQSPAEPSRLTHQQFSPSQKQSSDAQVNVGSQERNVSLAAGAALSLLGLSRRSLPGLLVAGVGGMMIYRGTTGHCHAYDALGINTAEDEQHESGQNRTEESLNERGIHVEQTFTINRPAEQLYSFWRNFENLPVIMTHLRSVQMTGDRQSHWVATAPSIAGGTVEWDAETTEDRPNSLIAWRSLPGSTIESRGSVRFAKAMGDRGTEVHVTMDYLPPGGKVGHWIATIFGTSPRRQMREDLRSFKRMMEIGEVLTTEGQSRGACLFGGGKRESR
jgi:uncharacterized membrane protein